MFVKYNSGFENKMNPQTNFFLNTENYLRSFDRISIENNKITDCPSTLCHPKSEKFRIAPPKHDTSASSKSEISGSLLYFGYNSDDYERGLGEWVFGKVSINTQKVTKVFRGLRNQSGPAQRLSP